MDTMIDFSKYGITVPAELAAKISSALTDLPANELQALFIQEAISVVEYYSKLLNLCREISPKVTSFVPDEVIDFGGKWLKKWGINK